MERYDIATITNNGNHNSSNDNDSNNFCTNRLTKLLALMYGYSSRYVPPLTFSCMLRERYGDSGGV